MKKVEYIFQIKAKNFGKIVWITHLPERTLKIAKEKYYHPLKQKHTRIIKRTITEEVVS